MEWWKPFLVDMSYSKRDECLILSWLRSLISVGLILSTLGRISYCIAGKGYGSAVLLLFRCRMWWVHGSVLFPCWRTVSCPTFDTKDLI